MAEERVVGIDLGTTNSLVAYMQGDSPAVIPGEDGDLLVPSVVAVTSNGMIVGNPARGTLLKDAGSVVYSAKRLMGRGGRSGGVEALSVQAGRWAAAG